MSKTTVHAIASGKGGVGKTTTTINLGAAFAERDHEVVVVDADLGMANLATMIDLDVDGPTLHEVLADDVPVRRATYSASGGFSVVPSGVTLEGFAEAEPSALAGVVDALGEEFEVILLDVGGGLSHDIAVPLGLADAVILVTTPDAAAIENALTTKDLVDRLDGDVAGVVLTRVDDADSIEAVGDELDAPVLAALPEADAVAESATAGLSVLEHDPDAPIAAGYGGLAAVLDEEAFEEPPVVPDPIDGDAPAEQSPEPVDENATDSDDSDGGTDAPETADGRATETGSAESDIEMIVDDAEDRSVDPADATTDEGDGDAAADGTAIPADGSLTGPEATDDERGEPGSSPPNTDAEAADASSESDPQGGTEDDEPADSGGLLARLLGRG